MRKLIWSKTFIRAFKKVVKRQPEMRGEIEDTLRLLFKDPFIPQLEVHKLKGKLEDSWACSAGYNLRIIFDFVKGDDEDNIFLIEIGLHEEVY